VNSDLLKDTDVHIHFPAGAISKDGPSAGVVIATVLVSLFTDRCVRSDTAMTGELTLRGLVLPVTFTCSSLIIIIIFLNFLFFFVILIIIINFNTPGSIDPQG